MIKKAPPPLACATAGNRQILPRPTAEPTVAAINPIFEENVRFLLLFFISFLFLGVDVSFRARSLTHYKIFYFDYQQGKSAFLKYFNTYLLNMREYFCIFAKIIKIFLNPQIIP